MRTLPTLSLVTGATLGLLAAAALPSDARACGGCFAPQDPPTVVSGHRMVMSVSPTKSVLWDQIQYAGNPAEFAWVLPVKPGAEIEASTAAFFETLEAQTAVRVVPPMLDCGGGSSGSFGCGASQNLASGAEDSGGEPPQDPVTVVHQGTVGPYETVTLSTTEPGALNTWLESHGYNVDATSQPIIDSYVNEGFDFIALRLQPGKGVSQMTPVRVTMAGGNLTLPLRMVGIGTGAETPIVLYVIGEGRYTVQNFSEVSVETSLLSWNFKTQESNYTELRDDALGRNDGRSWLTTYAQQGAFFGYYDEFGGGGGGLLQSYFAQALKNGETDLSCTAPATSGLVVNPCPPGEPWDSPACSTAEVGTVDARTLACGDATDVAAALDGMHLEDVWITRMEANLPRAALAEDLVLKAASSQVAVSNQVDAQIALEADGACPGGVVPRVVDVSAPPGAPLGRFVVLAFSAFGLGLVARRARRVAR